MNIALDESDGAKVVGWKAGLTAASVQMQLGVGTPDFGALLDTAATVTENQCR